MAISPITYELVHGFVEMEMHWQREKERADALEQERDHWKSRAEKAEQERDQWKTRAENGESANGSAPAQQTSRRR